MTRADARAGVAVKIFVIEDEIPPVGIVCIPAVAAVNGTAALGVAEENSRQTAGELRGDCFGCNPISVPGGTLDVEAVAEVAVVDDSPGS